MKIVFFFGVFQFFFFFWVFQKKKVEQIQLTLSVQSDDESDDDDQKSEFYATLTDKTVYFYYKPVLKKFFSLSLSLST